MTLNHVVKASVFLPVDDYADMDAAYRDAMPARTLLVKLWLSKLPKGARVEISMIAAHPETPHHVLQEVSALPQPPQPLQEKRRDGLEQRMMLIRKINFFAFLA